MGGGGKEMKLHCSLAEETEPLPTGPFGLCIVVPHMARLPQCSGHMLIRNLGSP